MQRIGCQPAGIGCAAMTCRIPPIGNEMRQVTGKSSLCTACCRWICMRRYCMYRILKPTPMHVGPVRVCRLKPNGSMPCAVSVTKARNGSAVPGNGRRAVTQPIPAMLFHRGRLASTTVNSWSINTSCAAPLARPQRAMRAPVTVIFFRPRLVGNTVVFGWRDHVNAWCFGFAGRTFFCENLAILRPKQEDGRRGLLHIMRQCLELETLEVHLLKVQWCSTCQADV